jgi:hypothetical protein
MTKHRTFSKRHLSTAINRVRPKLFEVIACLRLDLAGDFHSYQESDGVVRDAEAGRRMLCIEEAIRLLSKLRRAP